MSPDKQSYEDAAELMLGWFVCGTDGGRILITHVSCDWATLRNDRLSFPVSDLVTLIRDHDCSQTTPADGLTRKAREASPHRHHFPVLHKTTGPKDPTVVDNCKCGITLDQFTAECDSRG